MKRTLAIWVFAIAAVLALQTTAFAARGFYGVGEYTDTNNSYGFMTGESYVVYKDEIVEDPDFDEIQPGSIIWVAIGRWDDNSDEEKLATAKHVKDDKLEVSYKGLLGDRYIDSVTISEPKKDKIKGIPAGAYVRIQTNESYTGITHSNVNLKVVLAVNGVSYQETRFELSFDMVNRLEIIEDNSVYGVLSPTRFEADGHTGEVTFDFGNNIRYTARVRDRAKFYLNLDRSVQENIAQSYPGAHLEFYNFRSTYSFSSVGQLQLPINQSKFKDANGKQVVYAYKISGTQLTYLPASDVTYNPTSKKLSIRTQTLDNYVLSNQPLRASIEAGSDGSDVYRTGYLEDIVETNDDPVTISPSGSYSAIALTPEDIQKPADSAYSRAVVPNVGSADVEAMEDLEIGEMGDGSGARTYAKVEQYSMAPKLIMAGNVAADNPQTSRGPVAAVAALGMFSALGGAVIWRTRPFHKK